MTRSWLVAACLLAAVPASAQVVRVSVSTSGAQSNGPSDSPSISGDGRYVVFASAADNLVAGDTNVLPDIFLRDRDTDADGVFDAPGAVATTRLNLGPGGVQANNASYTPVITPDGRYVCFVSKATNLSATPVTPEVLQVYRLDRQTGATIVVSVNDGGEAGNLHSREPAISDDGDVVAFSSEASTLVPGPQPAHAGIYVRGIQAGHTARLTRPGPLELLAYYHPTISGDGRRVMYQSFWPGHLLPGAQWYDRTVGVEHEVAWPYVTSAILAADGTHAVVASVSAGTLRAPLDLGPETEERLALGQSSAFAVSHDGRYVATADAKLVDADLNTSFTLFLAPITAAAFDRTSRYLALSIAFDSALPGGSDSNGQPDILVVDLLDRLDVDDNRLSDIWEGFFNVHDTFGDPDGDGLTNLQEFEAGSHPTGTSRRYLAEGATGAFFATDIALANASTSQAPGGTAVLTFTTGDGRRLRRTVSIPQGSSRVIHAGAIPGLEAADFSTVIESDVPLAVSRTMTWDTLPGYVGSRGYAAHMETAAESPSPTWLFAEGSTVLGFDLFYLLQNPQATTTHATVRFLLPGGTTVTRIYDLAPNSRTTIYVNQIAGLGETDVSGDIQADAPIVAERAMYRSLPNQPFALGHGALGVPAAATRWFLAEGATGPFFDLYVLIANPGGSDAAVDVSYAKPDGSAVMRQHVVPAHSRFSVYVDAIAGLENTPVATTVTSTNSVPIVVERAMYWPGGFFDYYEGHASAGSTTTARQWVVAGGEYGGRYASQTYVLIANTGISYTPVAISILPPPGATPPPVQTVVLPPNSRTTVPIQPSGLTSFGVVVFGGLSTSTDLVVESAIYRTIGGVLWKAGADALAVPLPWP